MKEGGIDRARTLQKSNKADTTPHHIGKFYKVKSVRLILGGIRKRTRVIDPVVVVITGVTLRPVAATVLDDEMTKQKVEPLNLLQIRALLFYSSKGLVH